MPTRPGNNNNNKALNSLIVKQAFLKTAKLGHKQTQKETSLVSASILLLIIGIFNTQSGFAKDAAQLYQIPAQSLDNALFTFAAQAKIKIIFEADKVHNINNKSLNGTLTTQQVLDKLLQDSDYTYQFVDNHTVKLTKVLQSDDNKITLSTMTVLAKSTQTTTDPYNPNYTISNSSTATKTDTPLMDTPLSIEVIPKAVMQDQQAIQLSDVTKNVSSVVKGVSLGGFVEQFLIRGFNTSYTNYYDGYRFPQGSGLSLANAERVEIIKGAATNLYGRVEPGGMINVVTKRPQKTPYYALEQQFGSYDLYRTTADATGAVTQNGNLLYRLNLEYLNKNSFRDYGFNNRVFVAPSLTWKISERTQLDLDFMYSDQNALVDYGVPANIQTHRPANIPISRYLGEPSTDKSNSKLYNTAATITHAFNHDWKVASKFNYVNRDLDFPQTSPIPSPRAFNPKTGLLQRAYLEGINNLNSYFGTVDITGRFITGTINHNVLAGWDNYTLSSVDQNYSYGPIQNYFNPINIYNPNYNPTHTALLKPNDFHDSSMQWNGVYFQDQITLFDSWHILGGGRYDWMSETTGISNHSLALASSNSTSLQNGRFNPRAGLLYQPWQWLSLYSNYIESLGAANINIGVNGNILQPETVKQVEAGLKTAFFEDRLTSTVAFYSLTKNNMSIPIAGTFYSQSISKARSQGIELDIAGKITDNLNLIANYTYTNAVILQSNIKNVHAGNQLWNVPQNAGSLWAKYDLQQERLRGLSLGAGIFFQGQKQGDIANTYQLPGYGRVNALVKYKIRAAKTTLQFNVENILNHQYYAASLPNNIYAISPGAPITFMGSIKVEF